VNLRPEEHVLTITSSPVVTLEGEVTLREAARRLSAANVGAVVIPAQGARPMAVLSERDIVRALADGADPDEIFAADIMTFEPRYATAGQSIRSAGEEMMAAGVRHLPVVEDGEPVGMIAARDVMAVLSAALPERGGAAARPAAAPAKTAAAPAVLRELSHPGG